MKLLLALGILAVTLLVGLGRLEHKMLYYPMKFPAGEWNTAWFPGMLEDCAFTTADGIRLHGWFARRDSEIPAEAPYTLLFFHGNAGNITHRLENVAYLIQSGIQVFIFDYRGYGKSQGRPTEDGLYRDALAAYEYVVARPDVDAEKIVFFGRSLGGAVAVQLATQRPCDKLILESTFTSATDMAAILFPGLPVNMLVRSRFDSLGAIAALRMPLLIIHGTQDEVIPFELGQRLFAAANAPKYWYAIDGAGHNDTYAVGGRAYFTRIFQFIQTAR